jgi:hypothetical protein
MEQSSPPPSVYDLERAILLYTSSTEKNNLKEWQGINWLWRQLSWAARLTSHLGAIGSLWWKERYVFPVLCREGISHLRRFLSGEWGRSEEESLRYCFHFFAPYSKNNLKLFPEDISKFLSGVCPSFNTERELVQNRLLGKGESRNCAWFRDETFARYKARMHSFYTREPLKHVPERGESKKPEPQQPLETINEETKKNIKKYIEDIIVAREEAAALSATVDKDFVKAFPIRQEAEDLFAQIKKIKEEAFALLLSMDDFQMSFSEGAATILSEKEAQGLIAEAKKTLHSVRSDAALLRRMAEQISIGIEHARNTLAKRIHTLTRILDHVPMLEPTNPFRMHQSRLVKIGREKLKRFRLSLTKGPGPEFFMQQLEHEIGDLADLARGFYDEGSEISSMREKLHGFEHQIQRMLDDETPSHRTASLQELLAEVVELKKSLDVASDRELHFEHIVQSLNDLES